MLFCTPLTLIVWTKQLKVPQNILFMFNKRRSNSVFIYLFTFLLFTVDDWCASLALISRSINIWQRCVSVYAEEACCAEQVCLQEGVWPLWGSVEWSRAIWGGNLEGQDVCVFRGLDWEIGKAFGIMLSLGSTHTPRNSARAQMCHA